MIDVFQGKYRFLSNFYYAPIEYQGREWQTVEHAYQAAKTLDPYMQEEIRCIKSPGAAKRVGHEVTLRPDWYKVRIPIMDNLVRIKFRSHPRLAKMLLATGNQELIEGNHWHDNYWGCCICRHCNPDGIEKSFAKNHLGHILMRVREELREQRE